MSDMQEKYSYEDNSDSGADYKLDDTAEGRKRKGDFDELERLKKEKRLAMNRESARARRKRKKMLLETLETKTEDMNNLNQKLMMTNETLRLQVSHLETELATARSTIKLLTQERSSGSSGLERAMAPSALASAGLGADSLASILQEERVAALQRQVALSELSKMPGGAGGSLAGEQSGMDYLQLLSLAKR